VVPGVLILAGAATVALLSLGRVPVRRRAGRVDLGTSVDRLRSGGRRVIDAAWPDRRRAQRDAQLPELLDRLAASLRGGESASAALVALDGSLPEPLATELRPVVEALRHGAGIQVALAGWASSPTSSAEVRLVAAALSLGTGVGGEVARAVDRTAATLRERQELRGEVRALATQARASAAVLALAPLAFAGLVATIEPAATTFLVASPVGWACLGGGLVLELVGAVWMSRITGAAE
jgi:tight adherence protein B